MTCILIYLTDCISPQLKLNFIDQYLLKGFKIIDQKDIFIMCLESYASLIRSMPEPPHVTELMHFLFEEIKHLDKNSELALNILQNIQLILFHVESLSSFVQTDLFLMQAYMNKSRLVFQTNNLKLINKEFKFISVYHDHFMTLVHKYYLKQSAGQ